MSNPAPAPGAYRYDVAPLSAEDGAGYVVSFPDIPGCLGVGASEAEAVEDGQRALIAALNALKASDRPPPAPTPAP